MNENGSTSAGRSAPMTRLVHSLCAASRKTESKVAGVSGGRSLMRATVTHKRLSHCPRTRVPEPRARGVPDRRPWVRHQADGRLVLRARGARGAVWEHRFSAFL